MLRGLIVHWMAFISGGVVRKVEIKHQSLVLGKRVNVLPDFQWHVMFHKAPLYFSDVTDLYTLRITSMYVGGYGWKRLKKGWYCNIMCLDNHDDVIKWKHLPRYCPFVKGQWRGTLMFSLICVRINGWVNKGWWFETPSHPLWRHRNDIFIQRSDNHKFELALNRTIIETRSNSAE